VEEDNVTASVTLLVLAEDLDPDVVTKSLLQFPDQSWRRGEPQPIRATVASARAADWGGWKKFIPADFESRSVEEQLEFWASSLRDRSSEIAVLRSLGHELFLDCSISASFPFLIEMSDSLQLQLGALHLNVDFHIFANP